MTAVPEILLNNGRSIPQFGFGVFQIKPADTAEAVPWASAAWLRAWVRATRVPMDSAPSIVATPPKP